MALLHADLDRVDWAALKRRLNEDRFDNGRTPDELRSSFQNSRVCVFAEVDDVTIGKARALSDGVCNAYLVDVWVYTPHRRQGIASEMVRKLLTALPGQHVYLQTDDHMPLYESLGFRPQPEGLSLVVGSWLNR